MEKVLKTGKKIAMKELTALEEVLAYTLPGKQLDPDNLLQSAMIQRATSIVLSIELVDDEVIPTPANMEDVYLLLGRFTKKEWSEVQDLFDVINGDEKDEPGK